jgi:protein TonB
MRLTSDQYIEKVFLYFVALSLLIHVVIFALIVLFPEGKQAIRQEPYMVELEDMPQLKDSGLNKEKKMKRNAETRHRVRRETAPKGVMSQERIASLPHHLARPILSPPAKLQQKGADRKVNKESENGTVIKKPTGRDLLKQKSNLPELSQLFPSPQKMARLEENYRKKYGPEVEDGETRFLNTDDILFGSFLRRFETAVYGVWRYPSDAARLGIEGVTPVKITFNRKGEIEEVQLLESSGSKILDNEVFRTLRLIGPIGSFPKGFGKEKFHLIAFFQYGIIRGASQGMLH